MARAYEEVLEEHARLKVTCLFVGQIPWNPLNPSAWEEPSRMTAGDGKKERGGKRKHSSDRHWTGGLYSGTISPRKMPLYFPFSYLRMADGDFGIMSFALEGHGILQVVCGGPVRFVREPWLTWLRSVGLLGTHEGVDDTCRSRCSEGGVHVGVLVGEVLLPRYPREGHSAGFVSLSIKVMVIGERRPAWKPSAALAGDLDGVRGCRNMASPAAMSTKVGAEFAGPASWMMAAFGEVDARS